MPRAAATLSVAVLLTVSPLVTLGQRSGKTQPKRTSAAKTTSKSTVPLSGITGVPQLPGDNGKLGQAYMLGTKDEHLVFVLERAEYTLNRWVVGNDVEAPKQAEKLLMLTFTVQNNNSREMLYRCESINFTAVDDKDINHDAIRNAAKLGDTKASYSANLKPAQKVELIRGMLVPADASIPKLMVQQYSDKRVLRYDLRGKIKPLQPPFADPADNAGAKALGDVPCQKAVFYQGESLDIRLDGTASVAEKLGDLELGPNSRFLVVTLTFRNDTNGPILLRSHTIGAELKLSDGEKVGLKTYDILKTSQNVGVGFDLDPGNTYTGRIVFEVPTEAKPASVKIWQGDCHRLVFDVSDAK